MASSGGVRIGAGRKPAPEELVAVTVRIPKSLAEFADKQARLGEWVNWKNGNKSAYFSLLLAEAKARCES